MSDAAASLAPGRVLVTGANGFVGRAVMRRLSADGAWRIRGAVRGDATLPAEVERIAVGTIGRDTDWAAAVAGTNAVVHLAARVHVMRDNAADPREAFREVNLRGTLGLARAAAAAGVSRFVFVSSIKVNGEAGRFTEADVPAPVDPYGMSKLEAETGLRQLAAETGMEVVVVRPPIVYGPGVKANFDALLRAVRRGVPLPLRSIDNRRSMVAVDNLGDFLTVCLKHPAAANETFLVSDGDDLSTPELIRRMARAMNVSPRLIPVPEAMLRIVGVATGKTAVIERLLGSLQLDIAKARRVVAWNPPLTVEEGLRRAAGVG